MRKIKTHNESNKNKQVDRKIRLKSCLIYVFLLSLLPSCSKDEAFNQSDSHEYHTISIRIGEDTHISRAANQAGSKVKIEDLVLFTVGKESRTVLNTSSLEKQGSDTYSCRIPSGIDLPSAEFYAIANFKANFGAFASFEHKPFDEFLDQLVASTYEDNNSAATSSSTSLSYPLLNREAATYNSTTGTISDILLSHLPARIYLDCERLGYPIESITFNNVSRTTFLRTVIEAAGNGNTDELFDWTDDQPGIAGDGTDYYYLVYPSNRQASVTITSVDAEPVSADLGIMKPGYSYILRLMRPFEISFDEIATDGKITIAKGDILHFEFKVANTAIVREVKLTSSDDGIFQVTGGVEADWDKFSLEGLSPGEAILTAECMGTTINCTVVVTSEVGGQHPDFTVSPVESVIDLDAEARTRKVIITCSGQGIELNVARTGGTWLRVGPVKQEDPTNELIKSFEIQVFENDEGISRTGKVIISGGDTTHEYIIHQSPEKEVLPFTVALTYKGAVLGDELRIPVGASKGTLAMRTSTDRNENDGTLLLRSANSSPWAHIGHEWSSSVPHEIWHGRTESLLEFEENLGEERQMVAEFYSKTSGLVYHRMVFIQAAATNSYINLSASSYQADRYGTVYDEPFSLSVQSNKNWKIECADSWVSAKYAPGVRSQVVEVTVEENYTGLTRNTELAFVVDGKVIKTVPVTQSASENSTFTLKYALNLELNTTGDRFKAHLPNDISNVYYANDVQIYNPGTSTVDQDETIKRRSSGTYGFVVDAPGSFNRLKVDHISDKLLVYPNYRGVAASQTNSGGINIANAQFAQGFFRQIRYTLPIPAGVKRNQKVVYTIVINQITGNAQHDTPLITYDVVAQ